jgi:hypothetical protein
LEYKVVDNGEIKAFLAGCSEDETTVRLLGVCLERALRKGPYCLEPLEKLDPDAPSWQREQFAAGVKFHRFVPDKALEARVRHVADWIETARANNEPWLQKCDSKGRPLKLLKIMSLAEAEAEADKVAGRSATAVPHVGGEESVVAFADASRIVRLLTPAALDRENEMMDNFVDREADALIDGSLIIYSLRDGNNKAHVTFIVKVEGNELLRCRGRELEPVLERHMPQVRAFIERSGFVLKEWARMTGLVQDADGRLHSIRALPKGVRFGGDLSLLDTNIAELPEGLNVGGSLFLGGTNITELPEGLSVGGGLYLGTSKITALPKGLSVGGGLFLGTNIRKLPEGLNVGGNLSLYLVAITTLPKGLRVGGNLILTGTKIRELPDGIMVCGSLILEDSEIGALPEGLIVGMNLNLRNTLIATLPEGLSVGGYLDLRNTRITALPKGLRVGGDLNLTGTKISELPEGLSVGGKILGVTKQFG